MDNSSLELTAFLLGGEEGCTVVVGERGVFELILYISILCVHFKRTSISISPKMNVCVSK